MGAAQEFEHVSKFSTRFQTATEFHTTRRQVISFPQLAEIFDELQAGSNTLNCRCILCLTDVHVTNMGLTCKRIFKGNSSKKAGLKAIKRSMRTKHGSASLLIQNQNERNPPDFPAALMPIFAAKKT
jgi:hypothetical protein